jgi:hypothetical protein
MPPTRRRVLALGRLKTEVCPTEEGIANVKVIEPTRGAGLEKITRVSCAHAKALPAFAGFRLPIACDRNHSALDS